MLERDLEPPGPGAARAQHDHAGGADRRGNPAGSAADDHHFRVAKEVREGRTHTRVSQLRDTQARQAELAELEAADRLEMLQSLGMQEPALAGVAHGERVAVHADLGLEEPDRLLHEAARTEMAEDEEAAASEAAIATGAVCCKTRPGRPSTGCSPCSSRS